MERAWRTAMATSSLAVAAAAVACLFLPLVATAGATYHAWEMHGRDGGPEELTLRYGSPAFDGDDDGRWLRMVGPLLIASLVAGAAGALGALLPRATGATIASVLGALAAALGGAALAAVIAGSGFTGGIDGPGGVEVGGWLLGAAAAAAIVTLSLAILVGSALGVGRLAIRGRGGRSTPGDADHDPEGPARAAAAGPAEAVPAERGAVTGRPALAEGPTRLRMWTAAGALVASVVAAVALFVEVARSSLQGTPYVHRVFGYHHPASGNYHHDMAGGWIMVAGGCLVAVGILASIVLFGLFVASLVASRGVGPAWTAASALAAVGLLAGLAVVGVGLAQQLDAPAVDATWGAVFVPLAWLLGCATWFPSWLATYRRLGAPAPAPS